MGQTTQATGVITTLVYDQADRLTGLNVTPVGVSAQSVARYSYDGDGLRQSRTVSGTGTLADTWTGGSVPQLLQENSTSYLYGPTGLPLEQIGADGAMAYYYQDQLDSTHELRDGAGASLATSAYDPYGTLLSQSGSARTPFGFAGQYTDGESGLQYLRARYYDPATAQFLTRDPLEALTRQPYAYALADPLTLYDPLGLGGCNGPLLHLGGGGASSPNGDNGTCTDPLVPSLLPASVDTAGTAQTAAPVTAPPTDSCSGAGFLHDPIGCFFHRGAQQGCAGFHALPGNLIEAAECGALNNLRNANVTLHTHPNQLGPLGGLYQKAVQVQNDPTVNAVVDPVACALAPTVQLAANAAVLGLGGIDPTEGLDALAFRGAEGVASGAVSDAENLARTRLALSPGPSVQSLNKLRGDNFEQLVSQNLREPLNQQKVQGPVNGQLVNTEPDLLGLKTGVTDIKDVKTLKFTKQLRAQASYAQQQNQTFNLIIGPSTRTVAVRIQRAVSDSGGIIVRFDPATGKFSSVSFAQGSNRVPPL